MTIYNFSRFSITDLTQFDMQRYDFLYIHETLGAKKLSSRRVAKRLNLLKRLQKMQVYVAATYAMQ